MYMVAALEPGTSLRVTCWIVNLTRIEKVQSPVIFLPDLQGTNQGKVIAKKTQKRGPGCERRSPAEAVGARRCSTRARFSVENERVGGLC